eukprot:6212316-Pleurochrysis_carterae.AAC.1
MTAAFVHFLAVAVDNDKPPHLLPTSAVCCRYIDGEPCGREVIYKAPHYCEQCLSRGMSGMRRVIPRLDYKIKLSAAPWRNKIGIEANKKLLKAKQAHSGVIIKLSPVVPELFEGLYNYVCNLRQLNSGRHVTAYQQVAGSRGGEKQEFMFEIVSGSLTAAFFKSTFNNPKNQGSLYLREDGNVVAIIPPITFRLRYTLPLHVADFVMSVTYDVAALPRDGVFRFDEANVEISDSSKQHMKHYICGELRKLLTAYAAMDAETARTLLTPQQLVQVDFFAPAAQHAAPSAAMNQASTSSGVVGAV